MSQSVIDRNFGKLRSLAADLSDPKDRRALYNFCMSMRRHEPERYDEQWVPYLNSLRLPAPFATLEPEEIKRGWRVLPAARFNVKLDLNVRGAWPRDEDTLARLHDVEWVRAPGTTDELTSVLDDPIAPLLRSLEVLPLWNDYRPAELGIEELVGALTASGVLARIERLHLGFDSELLPSHLTRLFDAFDLTRLELSSSGRTLNPSIIPSCEVIFDLPGFERVDVFVMGKPPSASGTLTIDRGAGRFELGYNFRGVEAFFARLEDAPWEVPMRALHVGAEQMSARTLKQIAAADRCAHIETFALSGWRLEACDIEAFLNSWAGATTLDTLKLDGFRCDVVSELARSDRLENLRVLSFERTSVGDGALERLRQNPHLASCTILIEDP